MHNEQSDADFYILHELIKDYLSLLGVVKVYYIAANSKSSKEDGMNYVAGCVPRTR